MRVGGLGKAGAPTGPLFHFLSLESREREAL